MGELPDDFIQMVMASPNQIPKHALKLFGGVLIAMAITGIKLDNPDEASERIIYLVAGIIIYAFGQFHKNEINKKEQKDRDEVAFSCRQDRENYILYLRPFMITGNILVKNPDYNDLVPEAVNPNEPILDFELLIARSNETRLAFIALGAPERHLGAGIITADDNEWFNEFTELAQDSIFIIVLPGFKSGIIREIEWLKNNNLLYKCIFAMPPLFGAINFNVGEYWDKTKIALEAIHLTLPELPDHGGLFRYNENEEIEILFDLLNRATILEIYLLYLGALQFISNPDENVTLESIFANTSGVCNNCNNFAVPTSTGICIYCKTIFIARDDL